MILDQPRFSRREALGLFAGGLALAAAGPSLAQKGWTPPKPDRELDVRVRGGNIWCRVNGDLKGPKAPVLMIHGGPGGNHAAFAPGLVLAKDRAVILYDQLDCGRSDHPADPANWTVERYVSEVDAIRAALNLRSLHILGHSWGGTIGLEYAARQPAGLKSVILQGPLISTKSWIDDANALLASLPANVRDAIVRGEASGRRETPEYQQATRAFYAAFNGRRPPPAYMRGYNATLGPMPPRAPRIDGGSMIGPYRGMWGPTEFVADGTLAAYDGEPLLTKVETPALFLVGEFDEARPVTNQAFARRVKRGEFQMVPGSAHAIQFDATEAWQSSIAAWFNRFD